MAQATPILQPPARTVTIRDAPACTMVLAKHYSRKAVIEAYRQAGVRLQWLAKALETIRHSPKLQQLCEQERRRRLRGTTAGPLI